MQTKLYHMHSTERSGKIWRYNDEDSPFGPVEVTEKPYFIFSRVLARVFACRVTRNVTLAVVNSVKKRCLQWLVN